MKLLYSVVLFGLALLLPACSPTSSPPLEPAPILITVESDRVIEITTTPVPTTPLPAQDDIEIVPPPAENGTTNCYQTASTQLELNACAQARQEESEAQMTALVTRVEAWYAEFSEEDYQMFQQLQAEWQDLARRECEFQSRAVLIDTEGVLQYKGGSMAPLNFSECLVYKYEEREQALQTILEE
jgi:uncharacterized protein YecT (DUF1311 family)